MARGFFIYLLFTVLVYPCVMLLLTNLSYSIFIVMFLGIGLVQLVYVIPLIIRYALKKERETIIGVCIGACITALLNGGCYGMVHYVFREPLLP